MELVSVAKRPPGRLVEEVDLLASFLVPNANVVLVALATTVGKDGVLGEVKVKHLDGEALALTALAVKHLEPFFFVIVKLDLATVDWTWPSPTKVGRGKAKSNL